MSGNNAPHQDYSKYSIKHRRDIKREIGDMSVLSSVVVDIIAAYTQDDAKLTRMQDNLIKRLYSCNSITANKIINAVNRFKTDVITVAVCIDHDDSDVDCWIVTTNYAYPYSLSSGFLRLLYPAGALDTKEVHKTCLACLKDAGGVEDDEGRVWIQGRDE